MICQTAFAHWSLAVMHETETGSYVGHRSEGGAIHDERDFSINLNKPLPWFAIIVISFMTIFYIQQSRLSALNDRISAVETKADAANRESFDAATHAYVSDDHIQILRELMASHGVKDLPVFTHEEKPKCQ